GTEREKARPTSEGGAGRRGRNRYDVGATMASTTRAVPFPLRNGNAELRRIEARIAELEKLEAEPDREPIVGDGWRIEEDKADKRIRFYFDERPSREVVQAMKSEGWRWSRNAGAWQRLLNENGRWSAERLARKLFGYEPK